MKVKEVIEGEEEIACSKGTTEGTKCCSPIWKVRRQPKRNYRETQIPRLGFLRSSRKPFSLL
jgi:hypothetical protein